MGSAENGAKPGPGEDNPKRTTPPLPQRTIVHEAHREPESAPTGRSEPRVQSSVEPRPPVRAPAFALKGPLPDDPVKLWEMVIGACATQHRMRMLVGNMRLLKVDNDLALLQVAEELRPTAAGAQQELSNLLSTTWGQPVRVEIESVGGGGTASPQPGADARPEPAPTSAASPQPAPSITDHPLVKQAIGLFGAKVIGVQPRRKQADQG